MSRLTKKEKRFLVAGILVLFCIWVFLLFSITGAAAHSVKAYAVDAQETLYVAVGKQIRVLPLSGESHTFPFSAWRFGSIEADGNEIIVYSNSSILKYNTDGTLLEIEQNTSGEVREQQNLRASVRSENGVTYRYRSILGFYRIEQTDANGTTVRYRMPTADAIFLIMKILIVPFIVLCAIDVPVYFMRHNRFAKDGTILPPKS